MLIFLLGCLTAWLCRKSCPRPIALGTATLGLLGFATSAAIRLAHHGLAHHGLAHHGLAHHGLAHHGLAHHGLFPGSHFAFGLSSALIIFGLIQLERKGAPVSGGGTLQLLGAASYALYLLHVPVIILTLRAFRLLPWTGSAAALGTFVTCLAAAVAFHLYLEKPLVGLLARRLLPPSPQKSTAS